MQDALQVLREGEDDRLDVALEFGQRSCSDRELLSLGLGLRDIVNIPEQSFGLFGRGETQTI